MYQKHVSMERLNDKENKRKSCNASPYAVNYRSNLTHDQRALISHRNFVNKLHRSDLEDRYLTLLDEHFALKKENLLNHDKIRKLVTKILRLSGDDQRINSASSKQNLTIDEDMQIRIIDLESHNTQLKERLNGFIRTRTSSRSRCASAATLRAASSTPNLMRSKSKHYQSHDNLPLSVHQTFVKEDQFSTNNDENTNGLRGNLNGIKRNERGPSNLHNCPRTAVEDVIAESLEPSDLNERHDELKELKAIIEKLQQDIADQKTACDTKTCSGNGRDKELEVIALRENLLSCQQSMRQQEVQFKMELTNLHSKNQLQLDNDRVKMFELKLLVENEVEKNRIMLKEKESVEADLHALNITQQETTDIQAENDLLKKHRENIGKLAAEVAARTDRINQLCHDNQDIQTDLVEAQASIQTLQSCQTDMMQKIQSLQDANDQLTVQMEGIRVQCQCLNECNDPLEPALQTADTGEAYLILK